MASLLVRAKELFAQRGNMKLHVGKATILARTFLNPTLFSKPATRDEWLLRVRGNVSHYRSLYMLLAAAVLVYTVLSSPLLLVGLCLLGGAWAYAFMLTSPETPIVVFGMELRRREKLIALLPFSLLVVTLCGLITSLVWVCFLSAVLALPHASFHEVVEMDALDALELEALAAPVPGAV